MEKSGETLGRQPPDAGDADRGFTGRGSVGPAWRIGSSPGRDPSRDDHLGGAPQPRSQPIATQWKPATPPEQSEFRAPSVKPYGVTFWAMPTAAVRSPKSADTTWAVT